MVEIREEGNNTCFIKKYFQNKSSSMSFSSCYTQIDAVLHIFYVRLSHSSDELHCGGKK
jgi:hypothetical protein